jgi:DNA modification methylase
MSESPVPFPKNLPRRYEANVALDSLREWPGNPKDHDIGAIMESMQQNGIYKGLFAMDDENRRILAGHGTKEALIHLGVTEIDVVWVGGLTMKAARRIVVADNRIPQLGGWNEPALYDMMRLSMSEDGVAGTGYDDDDIERMRKLLDADKTAPQEPEVDLTPPEKPKSKRGKVYELGRHRVMCGDCTDPADWKKLLGKVRADLCLTDLPYGTGVDYKGSGFEDTPENVAKLAKKWLPIARENADVVVFSPGVTRQWLYPAPDWVLCWFYGGGQLRSPWGFNCWQPFLAYGGDPSLASGNGCRPDAIDMNTPANAADLDHPCPKPMPLWTWLIERLTFKQGSTIVDPFGGAGTTIIAAEQTERTAYVMELSPAFVDVTIRRWEAYAKAREGQ